MITKTTAALCASAIKVELKTGFSGIKFSVTSDNFSGGNSVHVSWSDGPTTDEVRSIIGKYQYGRFDGMTDMYEYDNKVENLPQAKYVQARREVSDEVNKIVFDYLREYFSEDINDNEINRVKYQIINRQSIPAGAVVTGVKLVKDDNILMFEDRFCLVFEATTTAEVKETIYDKVETAPGEVAIIDYSAKAIAVVGDTKPIKDQLKELGGKFNFRLSCGAGWIFPKSKLSDIQSLLTA